MLLSFFDTSDLSECLIGHAQTHRDIANAFQLLKIDIVNEDDGKINKSLGKLASFISLSGNEIENLISSLKS